MIEKKTVTGFDAYKYIREQLSMGGSLSNCMNALSIENGVVYTLVPSNTKKESLYNFEQGGIYPFDKEILETQHVIPIQNDAKPFMLNEIKNHLKTGETSCCLFEETIGTASDSWIESSGIDHVHLRGKEIFYFFDRHSNSIEMINKAIIRSESYIFLCGLSSLNITDLNKLRISKEINLEILQFFVKNISAFFVRAYDGEGYLKWVRS